MITTPSLGSLRAPLTALFLLAALCGARDAGAIPICGDNICAGPPFETATTCPQDCGVAPYCGDGICNNAETCHSCLNDCTGRCVTFTLIDALKKNSCTNDDDGDCLDNFREEDLAFVFAPHYFYDEDENCAGAFYTDGPNPLHYGRQDFFQLRPKGNPAAWTGTGGKKDVTLTYFLLHPHDCKSYIIDRGDHQGDSEHVVFRLSSVNLRTWTLTRADYYHHGRVHTYSGEFLKQRANEINTSFPSVAADEDGHGSWPGRVGSSSHCAGDEDDFCFGTCDCFRGTMAQAKVAGYREFLATSRNIGGPPPERFRASVVSVSGSFPNQVASSVLDVGHGARREYWTPRSDAFKKFCGWECPSRAASGDCTVAIHGESSCVSPLSSKIDSASFTPVPGSLAATEPAPVAYEAEESARLGAEVHTLLNGLSHLPTAAIEDLQERLAAAEDPIGEVAPLVAGRPRGDQLRTLEWVLVAAPEKLEAAVAPGLLPGDRLTPKEIEPKAAELVSGLIGLLHEAGYGGDSK